MQENVKKFFEFVGADESRKQAVKDMSPEQVVQYSHDNGFQLTLEELKQGVETIKPALPDDPKELSEEDLDQAAGGVGITTTALLVGGAVAVGVAIGALASVYLISQGSSKGSPKQA